jgi:hypothetical protein
MLMFFKITVGEKMQIFLTLLLFIVGTRERVEEWAFMSSRQNS